MNRLSKLVTVVTGLSALALVAFTTLPAFADSPGQIGGGDFYRISDLTQKTGFANPQTANACDLLEYSAELHNIAYDQITDLTVNATLPATSGTSNTSTITTYAANASPTTTSATATLNLATAQSVSYVNGSAELLDSSGNLIEKLPDGITQGGVNVGNLAGSATEFVNFEVQVGGCTTPAKPTFACNVLNVTQSGNAITASANTSAANGATLSSVTYNFGDKSAPVTTTNSSVNYTYAAVTTTATYTVTATANFNVNGSTTGNTSNCSKNVTITAAPVTPVTPTTPTPTTPAAPTALVNTGPGDVICLFAVATIAGAFAHRLFKNRQVARHNQ